MKILRDSARKMSCSQQDVITMACAMRNEGDDPQDIWRYYNRTNTLPTWLIDFLIDTMAGKRIERSEAA